MRTFSNRYIFIYSAVLVTVVALILTIVSISLKPLQERNQAVEKKQMILKAAGITSTTETAEQLYAENIREVNILDRDSLPAYLYETSCIIPVQGTGLWGPIWGYLCFNEDWVIDGAVFDHKSETPGLGGEIATEAFANRFIGKTCTDSLFTRFIPIVLKKSADPNSPHEVDAISGGTMTSNGITSMLKDCLSKYQDYMIPFKSE
ncbi:MAG: FMN-binding protein [Prevotella sp.]|nr:FMN-binding protein [Prevotella sp.]